MSRLMIGNPDTPFLAVDTRVAKLAREIRDYYAGKILVPDCIQLATAIHYEADGTSR
jgi:predicted nucleic acid-binding protein